MLVVLICTTLLSPNIMSWTIEKQLAITLLICQKCLCANLGTHLLTCIVVHCLLFYKQLFFLLLSGHPATLFRVCWILSYLPYLSYISLRDQTHCSFSVFSFSHFSFSNFKRHYVNLKFMQWTESFFLIFSIYL